MTGLPSAIGGRVSDPQRNPAPVCWRRAIRRPGLFCRRTGWSQPAPRGIAISLQRCLQILRGDLVMFDGRAFPDTQGGRDPAKACVDIALKWFFIGFHDISAGGQKRFEFRQAKGRRKCHRFACRADRHDAVASAGRLGVGSSAIALSPVCRRERDGLSVTTCLRHDRGDDEF